MGNRVCVFAGFILNKKELAGTFHIMYQFFMQLFLPWGQFFVRSERNF